MEHLPPKPRVYPDGKGGSANWPDDRNSNRSMAHPRDRDREFTRDRYSPGPPPRPGRPSRDHRDAYPPHSYRDSRDVRDSRDGWEPPLRDDRDRDDRRFRGGYGDRNRWDDRTRGRDDRRIESREPRGVYASERPKGDWDRERERGEVYDRDEDKGNRSREIYYGTSGARRSEIERTRERSPRPVQRPHSPDRRRISRSRSRSPAPRFVPRRRTPPRHSYTRSDRSMERPGTSSRRGDSVESRRSGPRRDRDWDRDIPNVSRKRPRSSSRSPSRRIEASPAREHGRGEYRRPKSPDASAGRGKARSRSRSVNNERKKDRSISRNRSISPPRARNDYSARREEKRPERERGMVNKLPSDRDSQQSHSPPPPPPSGPRQSGPRPYRIPPIITGANSKSGTPPYSPYPHSARERDKQTANWAGGSGANSSVSSIRRTTDANESTSNVDKSTPTNAPTGPRSSAVQAPPSQLPTIPPYYDWHYDKKAPKWSITDGLWSPQRVQEAQIAAFTVRAEAELALLEFKAFEQRRMFMDQMLEEVKAI